MNRIIDKVFSENPEEDLWRELLHFTYEANIKRYANEHKYTFDEDTINCITGSFLQACEYFSLAKTSNLQVSPLLLYYGTTNLLYGMTMLISGTEVKIKNHGINIIKLEGTRHIADTEIKFSDSKNGSVHVFARALDYTEDLTNYGNWTANEFIDSIAEISDDYKKCYDGSLNKILMLGVFSNSDETIERVYYDKGTKGQIKNLLNDVQGFKESYMRPVEGNDLLTGEEFYILRHKLIGKNIEELSYSGQPYLRAGHYKNDKLITLPTVINMYVILYVLSTLCRYHPERWSPFVLKDETGEKLLIQKFLYYARRIIPNVVLNNIYGRDIQYISDKYQEVSTEKDVGEHQIKDIVKNEVSKQIQEDQLMKRNRNN